MNPNLGTEKKPIDIDGNVGGIAASPNPGSAVPQGVAFQYDQVAYHQPVPMSNKSYCQPSHQVLGHNGFFQQPNGLFGLANLGVPMPSPRPADNSDLYMRIGGLEQQLRDIKDQMNMVQQNPTKTTQLEQKVDFMARQLEEVKASIASIQHKQVIQEHDIGPVTTTQQDILARIGKLEEQLVMEHDEDAPLSRKTVMGRVELLERTSNERRAELADRDSALNELRARLADLERKDRGNEIRESIVVRAMNESPPPKRRKFGLKAKESTLTGSQMLASTPQDAKNKLVKEKNNTIDPLGQPRHKQSANSLSPFTDSFIGASAAASSSIRGLGFAPTSCKNVGDGDDVDTCTDANFISFLKGMDCRLTEHLEKLKLYVTSARCREFLLFSRGSGADSVEYYLKIGGRNMTNALRACRRDNLKIEGKEQSEEDLAVVDSLGVMECVLTDPKASWDSDAGAHDGVLAGGGTDIPQYFVWLGEVHTSMPHSSGKSSATKYHVVMDVTKPMKGLWLVFMYEEVDPSGKIKRTLQLHNSGSVFYVGVKFDAAMIIEDIRQWDTKGKQLVQGDYVAQIQSTCVKQRPMFTKPILTEMRANIAFLWEEFEREHPASGKSMGKGKAKE